MLNEPGITVEHSDFFNYNKIIQYKNIDVAINNYKLREFIGINARNTYEENWSPEKVWQKII